MSGGGGCCEGLWGVRGGGGANLSTSLIFPFTALVRWNAFPTVSYHISIYNYFRSFRLLNHPRVNNISATGMFNKNWLRKYIKYTIIRAKHLQIKKTQTLWNRSKHTSNKQTLKTVQLWQCLVGTIIGVYIASNSIPLLQIEYRFHWENGPEKRPSKDRISIPMKKWWWAPFAWIVHVVPQKKLVLFCLTKMKMMTLGLS